MRKLLWFTVGFSVAVAVGAYLLLPDLYLYASGGCALILAACLFAMLRFPKLRMAAIITFGLVVGFLWQSVYDAGYLSIARDSDGQTMELSMTAADYSEQTQYGAATECFAKLNGKTFRIRVYHDEEIALSPGDRFDGTWLLRCTLPGMSAASEYTCSNGIFITARVAGECHVAAAQEIAWYLYTAYWRQAVTERLTMLLPEDVAGFARALLLGDTDEIDYETDTALKRSGIRHVVAVSGLHVSILFSLVYVCTGRRKWLTALLGLPVLVFFAALVGFSPSITRACIMHGLMVVAMLFEKEYDPPSALSFAVLLMLIANPWSVTNTGLQMSVGCVTGILLFATPIQLWLMDGKRLGRWRGWRQKLAKGFAVSVSISLSANVFTAGLSAMYFDMVSLLSLLTNLLTLWIVSFLFYGILLVLLASIIWMPLAKMLGCVLGWGIRYVLWIAGAISTFPVSAVYMASVYMVFWLIFCYALLVVFLLSKKKQPVLLTLCCVCSLCLVLLASWLEPMSDDVRMTVLDVGQGQCILLQSDGKHYMIDCGGDSDEAAADRAAALLLSQGVRQLDGLIITHYDADHAAGAIYLLQRIPVKSLFLPNSRDADEMAQKLIAGAQGDVFWINRQVEITFDETKITLIPSENAQSDNESGLCVLFQRQDCDILITGDRSDRGERELLEAIDIPQLDVLIVGHHGSKYSTCRELLIITKPEIAVISVGADNFYDHPSDEVLQRLKQYGCTVMRTDLYGDIVYRR